MSGLQDIRRKLEDAVAKKERDRLQQAFTDQLIQTVSEHLASIFAPVLQSMQKNNELTIKELKTIIQGNLHGANPGISKEDLGAAFDAAIKKMPVPKVIAQVSSPHIPAPIVNVPNMPDVFKAMLDYTNNRPLPVMMMDTKGNPFTFSEPAAGGRGDFFTIIDIKGSTASIIDQTEGALRVTGNLSASLSGATNVSLINADGAYYSSANPLPTVQTGSLVVASITASLAAALVDSGGVAYSGSNPVPITGTLVVSSVTNTIAAMNVDSTGQGYSGSNPLPITGTLVVSSITATTTARLDSPDGPYSAANPIPMTIISGALTSTVAVGDSAARSADNGGNPLKIGGIARQTNPTAFADGDRSNMSTDDVGRQVIRNHQVRDLIRTAYVTLSTGTETTLLAASAGNFLDLLYVMGANTSTAAVQVDIRAVTAGNVVASLYIPANSTAGVTLPVAWPQDATGNNWTVDMGDFTNSNVLISALFSQEV